MPYIAKAQETIVEVWNDIENAVHFAEQLSRSLIPAFWKAHDESLKPGARFDVWSIDYQIGDPRPLYYVGENHDFYFKHVTFAEEDEWKENPITIELPEPPDDYLIRRLGKNRFESAT